MYYLLTLTIDAKEVKQRAWRAAAPLPPSTRLNQAP
jgi:hypothetical protein